MPPALEKDVAAAARAHVPLKHHMGKFFFWGGRGVLLSLGCMSTWVAVSWLHVCIHGVGLVCFWLKEQL